MNIPPSLLLGAILWTSFLGMVYLGVYAWGHRRHAAAAAPFALLMFAGACYALGFAGEIIQTDLRGIRFWLSVEYLAIPWVPALWLQVALALVDRPWHTPKRIACLYAIPLLVFLAHHTDGWHGLYYRELNLIRHPHLVVAAFVRGPMYWVHQLYAQVACLIAGGVLLTASLRDGSPLRRRQLWVMFGGSLGPWLGLAIYLAGWSPYGMDLTPVALFLSGICYAYGLFSLGFLSLMPAVHEQVFDGMRDAVVVADATGRVVEHNPPAAKLFPDLAPGASVQATFAPWPDLVRALTGQGRIRRLVVASQEMGIRRLEANVIPVVAKGGRRGWAALLVDVTELHQAMDDLRKMATTDALTGVANRRRFMEALSDACQRATRHGTPLALIMLDLDHFKSINDRLGHAAGDAVLVATVARIQSCLREVDILARLGGEEFAVLMELTDRDGAMRAAERIRLALVAKRVQWEAEAITVTASLGIAVHQGSGRCEGEDLLNRADAALYEAKVAGRNQVAG